MQFIIIIGLDVSKSGKRLKLISSFSLPLLSLPLPGNKPQEFIIVKENYSVPPVQGFTDDGWPRWYRGPPIVYIQQIIVKSAVVPWSNNLVLTDAYRGPLAEVFNIIDRLTLDKGNE